MKDDGRYIPALGLRQLTPLYDPVLRWVMREDTFKRALVRQAGIQAGQRVLDLGCGTGTLTVLIKQAHPRAEVVGLDGDAQVLELARHKSAQAGVEIVFDVGMAFELPYPDHSFDRVLSSLLMHHLNTQNKQRTLRESRRVLRPGGELHVVDFGRPSNPLAYLISLVMRRLEETTDNIKGLLPQMMREAGFARVAETAHYTTAFGMLALYRAQR
ncbi:MAG: methyltransferase domain-containing protein [Chloroflexi bacterium]|nr:methyltransferase domain-containing protein [Chloroflexota bacterium]MBI3734498.1 methyltransferase domain-containing protein [Chloroflexota bacterium]